MPASGRRAGEDGCERACRADHQWWDRLADRQCRSRFADVRRLLRTAEQLRPSSLRDGNVEPAVCVAKVAKTLGEQQFEIDRTSTLPNLFARSATEDGETVAPNIPLTFVVVDGDFASAFCLEETSE